MGNEEEEARPGRTSHRRASFTAFYVEKEVTGKWK